MKKIDIEQIRNKKSIEELIKFSIINIDKPTGPTSFQISQYVKNALKLNKTSHFGTLDPMVTGVLPVALGRACRLNDYFMHRNKEYLGIMRLHEDLDEKKLKEVISRFLGKISQLPPKKSRVKRAIREREVFSFEILEIEGKDVLFKTEVQAGTYIRKLIHDMGLELGGAHMLELRRSQAGMFEEKDSINLYDFERVLSQYKDGNDKPLRKILVPAEIISEVIPLVEIKKEYIKPCRTGSPLFLEYVENKYDGEVGEKICLFYESSFIGVYRIVNENKVYAVPEFVYN